MNLLDGHYLELLMRNEKTPYSHNERGRSKTPYPHTETKDSYLYPKKNGSQAINPIF